MTVVVKEIVINIFFLVGYEQVFLITIGTVYALLPILYFFKDVDKTKYII